MRGANASGTGANVASARLARGDTLAAGRRFDFPSTGPPFVASPRGNKSESAAFGLLYPLGTVAGDRFGSRRAQKAMLRPDDAAPPSRRGLRADLTKGGRSERSLPSFLPVHPRLVRRNSIV